MPFDIDKIGQGEWFPFMDSKVGENGEIEWLPVDPNEEERVCFRQMDPDRYRLIKDKYRGKKIIVPMQNPTTKAMDFGKDYEQTPEQEKGERMEFWDESIIAWNIKLPDGSPIPCTAENKYKLVTGEQRFLRYANKCLMILSGSQESEKKALEKN